jgi:GAF domain-containing protein
VTPVAQPQVPDGPPQHAAPADWRAGALGAMHAMLVTTVQVDELLDVIVRHAAARAGSRTSAAITVRLGRQATVAAATDERSEACDRAEQAAGDGPCLDSARLGQMVVVPDVDDEDRWPEWRRATADAGFRSAAALPATTQQGLDLQLAINLYRVEPGDWDLDVLADVGRFAEDAARAVAVAARVEEQGRVNEDLRQAMAARTVIDQALGVVMAQNRCGPEEAFAILRRASQSRNQKMRVVAAGIVTRVSGTTPHSPHDFRDRPLS